MDAVTSFCDQCQIHYLNLSNCEHPWHTRFMGLRPAQEVIATVLLSGTGWPTACTLTSDGSSMPPINFNGIHILVAAFRKAMLAMRQLCAELGTADLALTCKQLDTLMPPVASDAVEGLRCEA